MLTNEHKVNCIRYVNHFLRLLILLLSISSTTAFGMDRTLDYEGQDQENAEAQKENLDSPEPEWVHGNVSVLWFPHLYNEHTHLELCVDGQPWSSYQGFRKTSRTLEELRDDVLIKGYKDRAFFKYDIRVTPKELKRLRKFLEDEKGKKYFFTTCANGVCDVLNKHCGVYILPVASQVPSLVASNLVALHKIKSSSRVTKIEGVGVCAKKDSVTVGSVLDVCWIGAASYTLWNVYTIGHAIFEMLGMDWSFVDND